MSLIEEALRKQREETERAHPAAPSSSAQPPDAPPALPSNAEPEPSPESAGDLPPEKSQRTWRMLAGVAVLILVLVAALIWMLMVGFKLFRKTPAVPPVAVVAASTTAATQTVTAIPPPANAATATVTVITPVNPAAVTADIPEVVSTVATSTGPGVAAVQPLATTPATGASTGIVEAVPAEKAKPPIVWPQISVSGIIGAGRTGRSAALVNGQMIGVGDSVESAKIISIDKHGVTFTYAGETRTLTVGMSTE